MALAGDYCTMEDVLYPEVMSTPSSQQHKL